MSKYTLEDIREEYDRLDAICGIDTSEIKLKISTRSVNRYGFCKYQNKKPYLISITDFILDNEEAFWDVIRHEYAHALVRLRHPNERHGHDKVFYAACKEVGCNPSRLSNFAREESKQRRKEREKYIVQCKKCGAQWTYLRAGTVVKMIQMGRGSTFRCPKCNDSDWLLTEK